MDRLSAMETFVRVVDAGSFSAAAAQLGVGQPAVSKAVSQLEQRLGARLLLRSTHGLSPTEAGRNYYEHARRAIEEAEKAELAAREENSGLAGRLRVWAPVTFARLHVVPHLAILLRQHPALEIDVILDDRNIDFVEAGIDVGLRMGPLADSSMTVRKIGRSPRRVFGLPAFFEAVGVPRKPEDLSALPFVNYDQRSGGTTWKFRQGSVEISIPLNGRVKVSAAEGVREAVFAGLGFAVASEWMFAPELASGKVRSVLSDWSLPPSELWAVFPTGRHASSKARAFVTFIENQISNSCSLKLRP